MKETEDIYSHPKWLTLREVVLRRDGYRCLICGSMDNLSVHHLYYKKDCEIWDYPTIALITLCKGCHSDFHENHKNIHRVNHVINKFDNEKTEILVRKEWMTQIETAAKEAREAEELLQQKEEAVLNLIKTIDWGNINFQETTVGIRFKRDNAIVLKFWITGRAKSKRLRREILYFPSSETYYDMNTKNMGNCSPYQLKEMLQQHSPRKLSASKKRK